MSGKSNKMMSYINWKMKVDISESRSIGMCVYVCGFGCVRLCVYLCVCLSVPCVYIYYL
jgi:hypothetical protein